MQDKERLLSFDDPHCFIFAHSALREGWDNPNVFQICTLRESSSDIDRRQSIGRGLRLCVNQSGERVWDEDANILTVVANESYREFATGLQQEYTRDGDVAPPPPKRPRDNQAKRNDDIFNSGFRLFWHKLQTPLRYRIQVNTERLVADALTRLNNADFPAPVITVQKGRVVIAEETITVKRILPKQGKAELTMRLLDESSQEFTYEGVITEGENLARKTHSDSLKPFGSFKVELFEGLPCVVFSNKDVPPLTEGQTYRFGATSTVSKVSDLPSGNAVQERYPVINIVARAARELGITKPTINTIFQGMRAEQKKRIFLNPEGFANVFIATLRNALADHITEHIAFEPTEGVVYTDLDDLFPANENYPQKEIVDADEHGLYDKIQVDSDVERIFIRTLIADKRVEFYFKFPPRFRIDMPKLIGDYNPDWGIARIDEDGKPVIYKIRETKGNADIGKLRFEHEKRKVRCAKKYFAALGIDYRPISSETKQWWMPERENESFLSR